MRPYLNTLGLELARFTQLKRHTRFDDFLMLVLGQGSCSSSKNNYKSEEFAKCEMLRYYSYAAKTVSTTVSQWTLTFSLYNHGNETCCI